MFHRLSLLVLVLALLGVAAPAFAVERVTQAPEIRPVLSGVMDIAVAALLRDRPSAQPRVEVQIYGQGRFSPGRFHLVSVDLLRNERSEVIIIDTTMYTKLPGDTYWEQSELTPIPGVSGPGGPIMPPIDPQYPIYRVGDTEVRGAATTQYQMHLVAPDTAGSATPTQEPVAAPAPAESQQPVARSTTIDLFVGKADQYLHKIQTSVRSRDVEVGELAIEAPIELSAFNQPQSIEPPPADQVRTMRSTSMRGNHLPGAQALPVWLRPILAQALTTR